MKLINIIICLNLVLTFYLSMKLIEVENYQKFEIKIPIEKAMDRIIQNSLKLDMIQIKMGLQRKK